MKSNIEMLDDGTYKVTVIKDNFVEYAWASSHHLTQTKINQLEAVIDRKAAAAFHARNQDISDG